jgi:hypothetical protein
MMIPAAGDTSQIINPLGIGTAQSYSVSRVVWKSICGKRTSSIAECAIELPASCGRKKRRAWRGRLSADVPLGRSELEAGC